MGRSRPTATNDRAPPMALGTMTPQSSVLCQLASRYAKFHPDTAFFVPPPLFCANLFFSPFILSLHADASPCLNALSHPWTVFTRMVRESGGIASAIAFQIPCQKGLPLFSGFFLAATLPRGPQHPFDARLVPLARRFRHELFFPPYISTILRTSRSQNSAKIVSSFPTQKLLYHT